MNSAAKLRNRGIAAIGATALIATAFGPAAMAWVAPVGGAPTDALEPGAASIGLIDADDATEGTQGATVVAPGDTNAAIGDVRFVIPSTFQRGDSLVFTLGNDANLSTTLLGATPAQDAADIIAQRVSFASLPAVTIDQTPYAATTHISATSPLVASAVPGSVEGGKEARYAGAGTPVAPQFTVALESGDPTQFNNRIRVTFTNDSDPQVTGAKFIGAINGAKVNVGAKVAANQDLGLTVEAFDSTPAADGDVTWWGDANADGTQTAGHVTTYPATIANVGMQVSNGSVVADNTFQFVGPVTVSSATPFSGNPVSFTVNTGAFDPNAQITATEYDANGRQVGTPTAGNASLTNNNRTVTYTPSTSGVKVVFSGMALRVPTGTQSVSYTLTSNGTSTPSPTGTLGSAAGTNFAEVPADTARNQSDIHRPTALTEAKSVTTVVPTRIGGANRYETAVKIAEADRGTVPGIVKGEADNIVIASGEAFPDALSAGYLAATKNAPILLTQKGRIPSTVLEFLKNYGAKNVFIVGGDAAVSASVESQLRNTQSYDVQAVNSTVTEEESTTHVATLTPPTGVTLSSNRLTGLPNAVTPGALVLTYDEASDAGVQAAELTFSGAADGGTDKYTVTAVNSANNTATVSYQGKTFTIDLPDAPADGAAWTFNVAASSQTTKSPVETATVADEDAVGSQRRIVPLNANLQVTRLGGANRFATNRTVNEYAGATSANPVGVMIPKYGEPGKKTALLANGLTPWDSLAAGPLVGNGGGNPVPLVLTAGGELRTEARAQMQTMDIGNAVLIGGESVIPASVVTELGALNTTSTRLAGPGRFETAKAIAEFALRDATASATNQTPGLAFPRHNGILANGGLINLDQADNTKWADALTAGAWAARDNKIIALTATNALPQTTQTLLSENKAKLDPFIAVGLGFAVSTEVLNAANALVAD